MERIILVPPGEILLTEFMEPRKISHAELAEKLDIPQSSLESIIEGKQNINEETAKRLSVYFATSIDFWLNLQSNYNLETAARFGGL